jgi:hypothetical protein
MICIRFSIGHDLRTPGQFSGPVSSFQMTRQRNWLSVPKSYSVTTAVNCMTQGIERGFNSTTRLGGDLAI